MTAGGLPNFLVIGCTRGGTTSLHRYLGSHPQIFVSATKELRFFNESRNWKRGLSWYMSRFEGAGDAIAIGESSPLYSAYPIEKGVPERIAATLPDVRFIYLIRDPVARIKSHYLQDLLTGREGRPIDEAVLRRSDYIHRSLYGMQLERYLLSFPRESILVIRSELLRTDRAIALHRIFSFLGVDPEWTSPVFENQENTTAEKRRADFSAYVRYRLARNRDLGEFDRIRLMTDLARVRRRWRRARAWSTHEPIMSAEIEDFLHRQLAPDLQRLRKHVSGALDGWSYE